MIAREHAVQLHPLLRAVTALAIALLGQGWTELVMIVTVGTLIEIHAFRLVVYLVETTGHLVHQVQVHYGRRLINERGDEQLVVAWPSRRG